MNQSREIVDLLVNGKLNEANPIFKKEMGNKILSAVKKKKEHYQKGEVVSGGNMSDSSGNNDLCDSSDNPTSQNNPAVSEQDLSGAPKSFAKRLERHIRTIHPHQARDKILSKAETTQNKLDVLGKIRNK